MTQNVFEFLGLSANHRPKEKVVQKVKHFDEVPESKKTWPMYGQIKKDGVYALVVITASTEAIFSRTGMRYTNTENLNISRLHGTGVYITELCNDQCSLETLSGIVNPNRKKDLDGTQTMYKKGMYLAFHDYLLLEEFILGKSDRGYRSRYTLLMNILPKEFDLIDWYYLEVPATKDEFVKQCIDAGEEGVVIKQIEEGWVAGHKGYRMMKEVRGVDYDLMCIGAEEGTGKYEGKVANLIFQWKNGKTIKAMLGKGWTHDDAQEMWEHTNCGYTNCMGNPIGDIFQVYALQESSKGKLRLPKVGELRHDKTEPDV